MTPQTVRPPAETPMMSRDPGQLVRDLLAVPAGRHHVLSCYVRLGPTDRVRDNYLAAFKDAVKTLEAEPAKLALSRDDTLAAERDLDRIFRYLQHPGDLPSAPGLALFACEELGLFEAIPLFRVHRTRLILDDTPWIAELVAAEREAETILVAVTDRRHARFFEVSPQGSTELSAAVVISTRGGKFHSDRGDAPGWGEHDYHQRLEQEHHRHYANVVQRLEELVAGRRVRGIVLTGTTEHTSALRRFIPDNLAHMVLGVAKLNPTAVNAAELRNTALQVAEEHDRQVLTRELEGLDEAVGSGWAVTGPRETLRALHRGQVRTLFVRDDLEGGGFRCSATDRLVLARSDCGNEGDPRPVHNLVDESIEESLRQRVRVVMVPECPAAAAVDGLAATLRFR